MCCDGVIQCLEKEKVSILIKDRHTCLDLNDSNMYVLKKGIVKVSLIMQDEREFNITYLQGPDVVSLYCDCLTQFRVPNRIKSPEPHRFTLFLSLSHNAVRYNRPNGKKPPLCLSKSVDFAANHPLKPWAKDPSTNLIRREGPSCSVPSCA